MSDKNLEFTENLLAALKAKGINYKPKTKTGLKKFAEENDIIYTTLHKCLREEWRGHVPEWDQLKKISIAVDKSIDWLLANHSEADIAVAETHAPYKTRNSPPVKISEFLSQTAAVLGSNSIYSEALKNNIHAFYTAVTEQKKERDPQGDAEGSGSQTRKKNSA